MSATVPFDPVVAIKAPSSMAIKGPPPELRFEFTGGGGRVPSLLSKDVDESAAWAVLPKIDEKNPAWAYAGMMTIEAQNKNRLIVKPSDQRFFIFPETFGLETGKESRGRIEISLIFSHDYGIFLENGFIEPFTEFRSLQNTIEYILMRLLVNKAIPLVSTTENYARKPRKLGLFWEYAIFYWWKI